MVLCIGFFVDNAQAVRVGGYLGVLTALVAWYGSSAALINGLLGRNVVRVGGPIKFDLERRQAHRSPAASPR